jgi:PilZ domain
VTDKVYDYGYRSTRFRVDFSLCVQNDQASSPLLNARCTTLSESGLACEIVEPLQIDSVVTLMFTLPGTSKSIRTEARVTNRHAGGHGLAFIFCSQTEKDYMSEYIESRRSSMVVEP